MLTPGAGGRRGLGPTREMNDDFLDHRQIFDASRCCAGMHPCRARRMRRSGRLDRVTTVLAGLDIDS